VHVRVLSQVERAEVEAERREAAPDVCEARVGQDTSAVAAQGSIDDRERCVELGHAGKWLERRVRPMGTRRTARERRGRVDEPGVQAADRPAVGFVDPKRRFVERRVRQCQQIRRRFDQAARHRELGGEGIQLREVVLHRHADVALDGESQHRRVDERIAVAVTADPRPHPHERGHLDRRHVIGTRQLAFERLLDPWHLREQRQLVVTERFVDLVRHAQPRYAEHRGLPQREHRPPQPRLPRRRFPRRRRGPLRGEQGSDVALDVQHRSPSHLGGVRREDRAHEHPPQYRGDVVEGDIRLPQPLDRERDAAGLRGRADAPVVGPAPVGVDILGDVHEEREPAERADDMEGLVDRQSSEPGGERVVVISLPMALPAHLDGVAAHPLDDVEHVLARLLTHDVAEHAADEPDVRAQGFVLANDRRLFHRTVLTPFVKPARRGGDGVRALAASEGPCEGAAPTAPTCGRHAGR
jgi:hypothetical protein